MLTNPIMITLVLQNNALRFIDNGNVFYHSWRICNKDDPHYYAPSTIL